MRLKKTLSMLLFMVMLLSAFPVTTLAANNLAFSVTPDKSFVSTGEEVTVSVSIDSNPGIAGLTIVLSPDESFEYVSMEKGDILSKAQTTDVGEIKLTYADSDNFSDTGILFSVTLRIKDTAAAGEANVSLTVKEAYDEFLEDVEYSVTPATITIGGEETGLTFKDGQTTYDFATLKADNYTLTAPGAAYHFAGWFSGLTADGEMITTDAQGRYILSDKATDDDTAFSAVECRPKYDEAPESGTFNALWIHEDNTATFSAMTLEVYETSFKYRKVSYTQQIDEIYSNNDAIRAAWKGAAGNGRVKLVKDMNVSGMEYYSNAESGYIDLPLKLDMNGRTLTGVQKSNNYKGDAVVYFRAGTSGNALESSHGQGCLEQAFFGSASYSSAKVLEAGNVSMDVLRDVDLIANNTTGPSVSVLVCGQSTIAKMENVNITLSSTGTLAKPENTRAIYSSNTSKGTQFGIIHNCTVTSNGYLIYVDRDTANFGTMTGCTMTATGTAVASPIYFVGGKAAFGAGNTVTAESSSLFGGAPEIAFTSAESTYQCAADGNVLDEGVRVSQTPVAGAIASSENGVLTFVPGFTLQFYNYDGTELLWADRYKTGETPADHTLTYGIVGIESYEHLGWSTTLGGTELTDPATLDADTALYAVRKVVTLPAVVSLSSNGGAAVPYASWDLCMDALDNNAVVVIKLLDNVEVSKALSTYNSYTLDLNGYTLTYTGSTPLYKQEFGPASSYFTLTSSAAEKGTVIIAEGAAGLVHLNVGYGSVYPVEFSNVKIVANHLAANAGWNQNGAPITITSRQTKTEILTMTDVEIVAANCPAVEFVIANAAVASQIKASFTNVKLSGSPVAVAVKSNNITGANHVFLTVDAASTFKGAADTYPIQETNGNFGLTPTYPEGYVLTAGEDGWYTFELPHTCDYTVLKADEAGHWYECECGKKQSEEVTAHVNEAGNDHKCDTCEYVMSQCNYVNGTCTICGGNDPNYVPPVSTEDIFTNNTGATPAATITAPTGGWKIGESNTFTVACEKACVVAYTTDGGATYHRLTATGSENSYNFTVDLTADMKFVVAMKGDLNGDGRIRANEASLMLQAVAGNAELTILQNIIADLNGDDRIRANEASFLLQAVAGNAEIPW